MANYSIFYNQLPNDTIFTAKEVGIAAASLKGMINRGMVEEVGSYTPKKYRKVQSKFAAIAEIITENRPEYFVLYKDEDELGMMCSFKRNKFYDCWENEYDISDVTSLRIGTQVYTI